MIRAVLRDSHHGLYSLYVLRQIVIVELVASGWISLRLLTWTAAVLGGTASVITWLHASGLRNALDPRAFAPGMGGGRFRRRLIGISRPWTGTSSPPDCRCDPVHRCDHPVHRWATVDSRVWSGAVDVGPCSGNHDRAPDRASARRPALPGWRIAGRHLARRGGRPPTAACSTRERPCISPRHVQRSQNRCGRRS